MVKSKKSFNEIKALKAADTAHIEKIASLNVKLKAEAIKARVAQQKSAAASKALLAEAQAKYVDLAETLKEVRLLDKMAATAVSCWPSAGRQHIYC